MRDITLTCLAGPLKNQVFHLNRGPVFIFGRYGGVNFNLAADLAVSHLHFLIDTSENRVRVVDLGSTNGLFINDRHFGGNHGEPFADFIALKSGDTILAGVSLFRLAVEDDSAADDTAPPAPRDESDAASGTGGEPPARAGARTAVIPERTPAAGDSRLAAFGAASRNDFLLPRVEGYSTIEKIGGGGKGLVYRAVRNDTGATVAIKMTIFDRNKSKNQRTIETFRREIQMTRQLDHPNIIRYLADGVSQGAPYLVLEYVAGGNLDELIRQCPERRMDLSRAAPLFIQILNAVAHMHSRWLVHRDIKPKNVLLDADSGGGLLSAKLSDMGLSCRFSDRETDDFLPIISEGGTPAYMPPEQLTDLTRAIPQSDVFSSAATLYHMLAGTLPYDFTPGRNQNEVILEGDIKPIEELRPDLPEGVVEVIGKSLSPNPENRYASAREMLNAFMEALDRAPGF